MDRLAEWREFSQLVEEHIRDYAESQYKDNLAGAYTAGQCMQNTERYVKRYGSGMRGQDEQVRDFKKIAHYACLAYFRYMEGNK